MADLSPAVVNRRELFVRAYLKDHDREQAYRDAGYKGKYARNGADRLLRDPWVKERIAEAQEAARELTNIETADVLEQLQAVAVSPEAPRTNPLSGLTGNPAKPQRSASPQLPVHPP